MTKEADFSVYRLKIQPGGADQSATPYEFCKENGIIGIGWGYNPARFISDDDFERIDGLLDVEASVARHQEIAHKYQQVMGDGFTPTRVKQNGDLKASLRYMIKKMDVGDLVWVNEGSEFAICRVTGEWSTDLAVTPDVRDDYELNDVRNFRPVEWRIVPYSLVPGFVKRQFVGEGKTLTKMHIGKREKTISKQIFGTKGFDDTTEGLAGSVASKLQSVASPTDVLTILDPADVEDVVLMKLQSASDGWSIIKSTASSSEADIECELRRVRDGKIERAFLQVKSGNATVSPAEYEDKASSGHVFFFAETEVPIGGRENMSELTPAELLAFAQDHTGLLPDPVLLKLDAFL